MLLWVFFLVTLTLSSGSHGSLPSQPLRIPRYADAIFTNSYRKVLGQLSARKLLQDIMNRQQGERNQEQGAKVRLGRQVDGVWTDQQQMALESTLVSLLQERRWEYVCVHKCEGVHKCVLRDLRGFCPQG
ncbi:somatoliberin [Bos javanicus]|nr:somatoliberin isoform X1 [Bos taurus]XP_061291541.1 somatoliberin [Bos javanicus]